MGNNVLSRKGFFDIFRGADPTVENEQPGGDSPGNDPLFDRYSNKTVRPRYYSEREISRPSEASAGNSSTARVGNVTSGLAPYTGPWTEWEVLHLVRRTHFGARKSIVDTLLPLTTDAAVDRIMNVDPGTAARAPLNWYQNVFADEAGVPFGSEWTGSFLATGGNTTNNYRLQGLRNWLFGRIINNETSIGEKMTWFWYHFIPVDIEAISEGGLPFSGNNSARILHNYFMLLRESSLGNYRTLIRAIATEPAMMYYLNNQVNSASAPDENFARELMELFTLGKDPASQYTEADVVAAAKVLTGWRVQGMNTATVKTSFVPGAHNTSNKQFSSFFNDTIINYQQGAAGASELDRFLDMIFAKEVVVSKYICRRLYRYFVYYDIDSNIEANVITPLAELFVSSNWEIKPVLLRLFKSQHFFDMANRGVFIKSPFDLVAGAVNTFAINTSNSDLLIQYRVWEKFNDITCKNMDQQMGYVPNVSGWKAYYQAPAYHQYWINTEAIQRRFTFIRDQFNGYTVGGTSGQLLKIGVIAFARQFGAAVAEDPDKLTATAVRYLLPVDLSQAQKDSMKQSTLLSGQITNSYWTSAWNSYLASPTNATLKGVVETRLKNLLSGICHLAEYQLM